MVCVVHMSVPAHTHSSLQHLPFCVRLHCHSVSIWMNFRNNAAASWHHRVESLLLHGQSALSITFSPTVTSWCELPRLPVQMSASIRESPWCSDFKFCVLPTGHTQCHQSHRFSWAPPARNSPFAGFLERCISVNASSPPQIAIPIHPTSGCRYADFSTDRCLSGHFYANSRSGSSWFHLLRTMFSALRVLDQSPRHSLTRLCRRLCTASHLTMPPHNYRSRSSSSGVSSPMTLQTAKPRHRHIAMLAAPHLHNLLTLLRFAAPAAPATPATVTRTLRPHVCHHSRLLVSRSMARQCASHGIPVKAAPVRPRLCTTISVTPPQPHVSTTQVGTHPVRSGAT